MGNLVTDVKSLELETLKNLKSSKALNTLRAYKADYKDFTSFCLKNGFKPMPSEPKIISLYLTYLSKSSKFSTLKRRLASISVIHKLSGHYIDIKHPMITENLMGIKRIKGSYQKAKKPILINELKLIVDVIDKYLIKNNIPVQFHYPYSLNKTRALSRRVKRVKLLNSEKWARECISLPLHPYLSINEAKQTVNFIKKYFRY